MNSRNKRRAFIHASATVGTGLILSACGGRNDAQSWKQAGESGPKKDEKEEGND